MKRGFFISALEKILYANSASSLLQRRLDQTHLYRFCFRGGLLKQLISVIALKEGSLTD